MRHFSNLQPVKTKVKTHTRQEYVDIGAFSKFSVNQNVSLQFFRPTGLSQGSKQYKLNINFSALICQTISKIYK
ncbi:MAG: hypothetical protein LBF72_00590 [Holosporales bacterium]|jgi:hypothetical protein|nr:hypothetical protein [Holosporales bacterium]